MNSFKRPRRLFSPNPRAAALAINIGKKTLACSLVWLMVPLGMGDLYAQTAPPPPDQQQYQDQQAPPPPDQQYGDQDQDQQDQDQGPPPQAYNPLPPQQIDDMVAPIALYPDSLVAQILAASTYPDQIADADHFLQANQGLPPDQLGQMVNGMNWDPSIKALIAFPSVLNNLDRNMDWTTQLGNAYYNQPQDVMSAVQDMRQRAYSAGHLRSTPQIAVDYQPGDIVIAPANPDVVYVPWYNPWDVYGEPLSPWQGYYVRPRPAGLYLAAGLGIGFGVGIAVGTWNHWGWGYHNWGMGWRDHSVVYNRNVYISDSHRVVNHGYYGHFDRNPQARVANRNIAMRAPNYHRANNANRPGNFNRPNNNVRNNNNVRPGNGNFNRPNNTRPNNNVRPAYRPGNNTNRPAPNTYSRPNAQPNNRPNNSVRPNNTYTRPSNNARPAQNYNRPQQQARPQQQMRPQSQARPQQQIRPQSQGRPQQQARPQAQRQARPESRPASRPPARSNDKKDNGH
jgi:hypothetical protein